MELYNPIIRECGGACRRLHAQDDTLYDPAEAWEDTGAFELVMLRDAACELGGSGKSAVNFTCVTSSSKLVPEDEIVVCGSGPERAERRQPLCPHRSAAGGRYRVRRGRHRSRPSR